EPHGVKREQRASWRSLRDRGRCRTEAECSRLRCFRCRPLLAAVCKSGARKIGLAIGPCYEDDCQTIEHEHQGKIGFRAGTGVFKFFPHENSPKRRNHGRRLADSIGNCNAGETGGHQIEDGADTPDKSPKNAQQMPGSGPAEKSTEAYRLSY